MAADAAIDEAADAAIDAAAINVAEIDAVVINVAEIDAAAIDAAAIEMAVEIEFHTQDECAYCWNVMTRTMWPRIRFRLKCISMVLGISIAGVIGYMWVCGSIAVSFGLKPGRCFIG